MPSRLRPALRITSGLRPLYTISNPTATSFRASASASKRRDLPHIALFGTSSKMSSSITPVSTDNAARPAGPYSQAIKTPGLIFVSGQVPVDPQGNLIGGTIAEQTAAVCRNVKAVVEAAGSSLDKVVKVNVFLDDMANFTEMNGEYAKWFTGKPARSTVAVKALPLNVPVEIECVAMP